MCVRACVCVCESVLFHVCVQIGVEGKGVCTGLCVSVLVKSVT